MNLNEFGSVAFMEKEKEQLQKNYSHYMLGDYL